MLAFLTPKTVLKISLTLYPVFQGRIKGQKKQKDVLTEYKDHKTEHDTDMGVHQILLILFDCNTKELNTALIGQSQKFRRVCPPRAL